MTVDYRLSGIRSERYLADHFAGTHSARDGITIVHIALQGCLRAGPIEYGKTADTGGHIRYLLELVNSLARQPEVGRQIILTRAFRCQEFGGQYERATERLSDCVELWRCFGDTDRYLAKEDIWPELPTLTRNFERRLCRSAIWPDVIHAHYADAGWIAGRMRSRFGIPFIFTAHSLGLVKAQTYTQLADTASDANLSKPSLSRRVDIEHYAASQADIIVASSNDEVVNQYGLYSAQLVNKCVINPPGCDLKLFTAPTELSHVDAVGGEIGRFLLHPDRPPLLALARPVAKKNLTGLLHAYGQSPELQARANLVICAGNRDDIGKAEDEISKIIRELIYLLDYYDLYGSVALPKSHTVEQVPAIYQWAAQRRGIFINIALNEPFGLTLLEAAASGLPVVATQNGGPRDILAHCKSGLLVNPTKQLEITCAALTLLQNDALYNELRRSGLDGIRKYNWPRHAQQYLKNCCSLIRPKSPGPALDQNSPTSQSVIATDLDDTLLGDATAVRSFSQWRATANNWLWVVATGRNPDIALQLLRENGAPLPDYIIGAVGTEVYKVGANGELTIDGSWSEILTKGWQRDRYDALIQSLPGLAPQDDAQQRQFKLSYKTTGDATIVDQVQQLLHSEMLHANIVLSHANLLDVIAPLASKGLALRHLVDRLPDNTRCVIAAGDSGNDLSLIASADAGIVVANHNGELNMLRSVPHVYWSRKSFAAGVLDGVEHFTGPQAPALPIERTAVDVI